MANRSPSPMSRESQRPFRAQNRKSNRRQRFIEEYVVDCNGAQAAQRAGYSPNGASVTASRLLANANVRAEIEAKLNEKAERTELTADEIINGIRDTVRRCEGPGRQFQPSAALKGYELLGKHKKLWTDKVEVTGLDGIADKLAAVRAAKIQVIVVNNTGEPNVESVRGNGSGDSRVVLEANSTAHKLAIEANGNSE
jgi:phage terminase small subunit